MGIFFQGEQFMFWHNFLQINEHYVFHNLRETTMNKVNLKCKNEL